jgi:hypothetical protein
LGDLVGQLIVLGFQPRILCCEIIQLRLQGCLVCGSLCGNF